MWRDKLNELRKANGNPSYRKIATDLNMSEKTVIRTFTDKSKTCYVDTVCPIIKYLGGSLDEVFGDTGAMIGSKGYAELQEKVGILTAEIDLLIAKNAILNDKVINQDKELDLLKKELAHKEELLALHSYYKKHIENLIGR
jgi:hypothetical protein